MTKPTKPTAVTLPPTRLQLATQIMAGLLASGHYTERASDADENEPRTVRYDHGKDWEKDGVRKRFICYAIEEFVLLLKDLEAEVATAFPTPKSPEVPQDYQPTPVPLRPKSALRRSR